jgi:hypothetical protein
MAVAAVLTLIAAAAGVWSGAWATRVNPAALKHGSFFAPLALAPLAVPNAAAGETTAWSEGKTDQIAVAGTTHWGHAIQKENVLLSWSSSDRSVSIAANGDERSTDTTSWTAEAPRNIGAKLAPTGAVVVAWAADAPSTTAWSASH